VTKTQYYTATSLDGFIADPDNSLDWLLEIDDLSDAATDTAKQARKFFAQVGAFCMGSTTYEWVMDREGPEGWLRAYGDLPGWVFTHRNLTADPRMKVTFVSGDVAPVHEAMTAAAAGRNIWVVGGGELAGQFADAGLLDEIILSVAPVTLGGGAPLLPRRLLANRLRLTQAEPTGPFASLTYTVASPD
jgi:dihydrofolate reductase